jgi:hypothetical protein
MLARAAIARMLNPAIPFSSTNDVAATKIADCKDAASLRPLFRLPSGLTDKNWLLDIFVRVRINYRTRTDKLTTHRLRVENL